MGKKKTQQDIESQECNNDKDNYIPEAESVEIIIEEEEEAYKKEEEEDPILLVIEDAIIVTNDDNDDFIEEEEEEEEFVLPGEVYCHEIAVSRKFYPMIACLIVMISA